jgi:hypothetical protein
VTLKISDTLRTTRADAITTFAGNASTIKIYDGTQPATGGGALSGNTLLATLTCGSPFAAGAATGVLTASAITSDASADATGTASWFRWATSGATYIADGTVGTSGADLNLNTTSIVAGGVVSISSMVLTEGNPN